MNKRNYPSRFVQTDFKQSVENLLIYRPTTISNNLQKNEYCKYVVTEG